MNKLGFLSSIIFFLAYFFPFLPLGIYFDSKPNLLFGVNSYFQMELNLFHFENTQIFLWGIISDEGAFFWHEVDLITTIFFLIIGLLGGTLTLMGSFKETETGKKITKVGTAFLMVVFLYSIIGFPIYSNQLVGIQLNYVEIFLHLYYGFYFLLISTVLSIIARIKHPISE